MADDLNIALISAGSALLGSVVGGVISFYANRDTNQRQWRQSLILRDIERRETLYSDFIAECAKKLLGSLDKKESGGAAFAQLYTLLGMIRMISSPEVRAAAEELSKHVTEAHMSDHKKDSGSGDSVFRARNQFTEIARTEIEKLKNEPNQ